MQCTFYLPFTLTLLSICVLGTRFSGTLYRNSCRLLIEPEIKDVFIYNTAQSKSTDDSAVIDRLKVTTENSATKT